MIHPNQMPISSTASQNTNNVNSKSKNDFDFGDININFNDLNLKDNIIAKPIIPQQPRQNQNINSNLSVGGSSGFGVSGMNKQSISNYNIFWWFFKQ